jgi:hypothetical protein
MAFPDGSPDGSDVLFRRADAACAEAGQLRRERRQAALALRRRLVAECADRRQASAELRVLCHRSRQRLAERVAVPRHRGGGS